MSSIFRLRKSNDKTLEEIEKQYLWFGKPELFNEEDANICYFMENSIVLKDAIKMVFGSASFIGENAKQVGICCMCNDIPEVKQWKVFPGGSKGIFVEYDRDLIEEYFKRNFAFGNCIQKVEYSKNPLIFETKDGYDILWNESNKTFKTIDEVMKDDKLRDQLFLKMFTRIKDRYKDQKELRIILAGRNQPKKMENKNGNGYEVLIPNVIKRVHIQPKTPKDFVAKIKALNIEVLEYRK